MTIWVHCIHWFKVKEHMMRINQTKIYSALQTGIQALRWGIPCSRGVPGPEWYIHNQSQRDKVSFIQIQEHYSVLDGRFWLCLNFNQRLGNTRQGKQAAEPWIPEPCPSIRHSAMWILSLPEVQWYASKSCYFATNKWANVLYSDRSTQYCLYWLYCHCDWQICSDRLVLWIWTGAFPVHLNFGQMPAKAVCLPWISELCLIFFPKFSIPPRVCQCQMGLATVLCWSCHNATQDICRGSSGAPEFGSYARKCCGIATNLRAGMLYSDIRTQYRLAWYYCQTGLGIMQGLICCHKTHDRSRGFHGVPESGWIMLYCIAVPSKCVCALRLPVHSKFTTDKWFEAHCSIMHNIQLMPFIVR